MQEYDVIIAGFGPSGAVAANFLGAHSIDGVPLKVLVLEPEFEIVNIPRAVHFDGEIMRIFQYLGLSELISKDCSTAKSIQFINGKNWRLFEQDFAAIDKYHHWSAVNFFGQPELETHLRKGVERYNNVDVKLGWSLSSFAQNSAGVTVSASNTQNPAEAKTFNAPYLLAADGATSPCRKLLGIEMDDLQCDEPWLVVDLNLDENLDFKRDTYQICDPKRPTSLIPCEKSHIRWEFMINPDDDIKLIEQEASIRSMMAPHLHRIADGIHPDDGDLVRGKVYTFHGLIAKQFQKDRVFLLGDAAHQMPPFLGQGMCTGIRDAQNICWKLAGVLDGRFHPQLLDTYTSERLPQAKNIVQTAMQHGEVIQTRNPLKALLRDCYLKLGRIFPPLISFLKFGFPWQIGGGLLAKDGEPEPTDLPGWPLRQALLKSSEHSSILLDELMGKDFALIGFGVDPEEILRNTNKNHLSLRLKTVQLGKTGSEDTFDDTEGKLSGWAKEHNIALALVRPDRIVYGICKNEIPFDLSTQLSNLILRLNQQLNDK